MNPSISIDGPRACRDSEVPEMIAMANSVMRQGSPQSFLTDYPLVYREENLGNVQVIKSEETIVSVVPFLPKLIDYAGACFRIGIISPTATHPGHRRLGYAGRCLDACLSLMDKKKIELCVLWTLPATFPFYEQAGFQAVPSQLDWVHCTKDDAYLFRDGGHTITILDSGDPRHLQAITQLRQTNLCGVMRSENDTRALFSLPRTITYLALDEAGIPNGYLIFCNGSHKPGILEADGESEAIESLLRHVLTATDLAETPIYLIKNANVLSTLVRRHLKSRVKAMDAGPMMIRINDPVNFLHALRPWLEKNLAPNGASFSLEINETRQIIGFRQTKCDGLTLAQDREETHHLLTRRQLTEGIFGSWKSDGDNLVPLFPSVPPFHFPIPMLDHS
jgi:predicted acetyltransferase